MPTTFEPGQYIGKVLRWAMVKAKNEKQTPQFAVTFLPTGRVNPQNPDADLLPCPDLERTIFRAITGKTAQWVLRDLRELFEYPHGGFGPLDPEADGAFDFHDKEFPAVLTFEEYDGKTREKWNFATSLNVGEPLTTADIKKLDTLYGIASPKRDGRKPKPKPQPPAATEAATPAVAEPVPI
jgi:hypothetical protein